MRGNYRPGLVLLGSLILGACSSQNVSVPARTATEQLLISSAVDEAADKLSRNLPVKGRHIFVDATFFESYDRQYAIGTIRDSLLRHGGLMAASKTEADLVIEIRAGALSIDQESSMIGVPSLSLPVTPILDTTETPELALIKEQRTQGIAKVAATAYDRESGVLVASTGPVYGFSNQADWVLGLVVSWDDNDVLPEDPPGMMMPWSGAY